MKQNFFALLGPVTVFALAAPPQASAQVAIGIGIGPYGYVAPAPYPYYGCDYYPYYPCGGWGYGYRGGGYGYRGGRIHCTRLQRWARRRRAPLNSPGDYAYGSRKNDSLAVLEEEFNGSRDSTLL
jgi:hypothetical protein